VEEQVPIEEPKKESTETSNKMETEPTTKSQPSEIG
jgi:hypothetical protein